MLVSSMLAFAVIAAPTVEIHAPSAIGELKGTLVKAPSPAAPVVLIIPGSGPTDRDGNSPLGINAAPYRLIADGLAASGVSTVRIDKRGMFASAGAVSDANAVTMGDYVDDTRAWISAIRETTGTDCIWLLGHSEGGLVALATAQEDETICGVILLATPGRPLGDVIKEQLRGNPANSPFLSQADAAIDALSAGDRIETDDLPDPLASLFAPAAQGFLISVLSLDPAQLVARISKPILILQGDRDVQVSVWDAELLKAAAPKAHLICLANTNHVFKAVESDDRAVNLATYADPNLPLASGVTEAIAMFLEPWIPADGHK